MPQLLDYVLNIDSHLFQLIAHYGNWAYLFLFLIIFSETGLVVTPFLPGDSLLFAVGSLAAQPRSGMNVFILLALLITAAIVGNQLNYFIGRWVGPKVFKSKSSWFFNKKHLERAHAFYEKHGGVTIFMARFIPIVRSFVPFVAGISSMNGMRFFIYNVGSAILWVTSILLLGYFLGTIPFIQQNFSLVIYSIIVISFLAPLSHVLIRSRS